MPEPTTSLPAHGPEILYSVERRRFPRVPVPNVVVGLEPSGAAGVTAGTVPDDPAGFTWVGSAMDISLDGLSLALPDDIPLGSEVLLTFKLDSDTAFVRVPAIVVRRKPGFGLGAVLFLGWDPADWQVLRAFLDRG
jgi:hypothetical protein